MKKSFFAFLALSTNALAGSYADHVANVKAQRPYDTDKIKKVDLLATDMVIHYENAVVVGTTAQYEERAKIYHFDSFLDASDKICGDIDLAGCIYELVCEDKIDHNLNTSIILVTKNEGEGFVPSPCLSLLSSE